MGFNTTIVLLNDALHLIREDRELGRKIYDGVLSLSVRREPIIVSSGGHCNPIEIVETHHADALVPVLVGGNCGQVLDTSVSWREEDPELALLRRLAEKRGFILRRKAQKDGG